MGIYIKGMKMPTKVEEGIMIILTDEGKAVKMFDKGYEAIELPPHGRLIDADALYEQAKNTAENYCGFFNDIENVISARDIELASTIIPAEEDVW